MSFSSCRRRSLKICLRLGSKDALVFIPYGPYFRKMRRMLQAPFEKEELPAYRPIEEQETSIMLYNILQDPSQTDHHVHRLVVLPCAAQCFC